MLDAGFAMRHVRDRPRQRNGRLHCAAGPLETRAKEVHLDDAQAILLQPPAPGDQNTAGNAAALTQQVLQAQSNLLQTQNTLYTIWVNFLISRMSFYLDLELMQLDERGLWCEESVSHSDDSSRREPARPDGERLPTPRALPGAEPGPPM